MKKTGRVGAVLALLAVGVAGCSTSNGYRPPGAAVSSPRVSPAPVASVLAEPVVDDETPSDRRRFEEVTRITGELTPKSVAASPAGFVVAQNMIYTHTVSVYDRRHALVKTLQDDVTPADFGYPTWTSPIKGGPVEASFSPDGRHVWVSNYSMYGPGFSQEGHDTCAPGSGYDRSFLYRVETATWTVDGIVEVGVVPKYVTAAPDGRTVLVTNWCSYDLSVIDTASMKELARIPVGRYPRGIAVTADSRTAYVAIMGGGAVKTVDIAAARRGEPGAVRPFSTPGRAPRHLNLSPDGKYLYVTLNGDGEVAKVSAATGQVLDTVRTGQAPRSSVLSPDGTALFVVNYESDTVSRVRTRDLAVLESRHVDHHPIGITYNPATDEVWVCSYIGVINVLADAEKPT